MARVCISAFTLQKQSRINQKSLLKPIAAPLLTASIQNNSRYNYISVLLGVLVKFHAFCTTKVGRCLRLRKSLELICCDVVLGRTYASHKNGPRLITPKRKSGSKKRLNKSVNRGSRGDWDLVLGFTSQSKGFISQEQSHFARGRGFGPRPILSVLKHDLNYSGRKQYLPQSYMYRLSLAIKSICNNY